MTKSLENRKYKLIQGIMSLDNESSIVKLEDQLEDINKKGSVWSEVIKPIRESVSIEEMIKEQNYKPVEKEAFFKAASAVGIEESIEDLLAMLD